MYRNSGNPNDTPTVRLAASGAQACPTRRRRASLRTPYGVVDQTRRRGVVDALARQFEAAENRSEQIVEIVSDAAGQLTDRFKALRLTQLVFESSPGLLRFGSFGDARVMHVADHESALAQHVPIVAGVCGPFAEIFDSL